MQIRRLSSSAVGHCVISVLCGVQIIGFTGCSTALPPSDFDPNNPLGLFANSDTSSDTLGAIRLPTGETVFVFGEFFETGLIRDINGAILHDQEGREATATFDNGFVTSAKSFDDSTLNITYDEISTRHIRGRADLSFSALDEADREQSTAFDIDLEQAAADLANDVRDLLGIDISDEAPPEDPFGKAKIAEASMLKILENPSSTPMEKVTARAQLVLVLAEFHVAAFAALGFVLVEIMAKLVGVIFEVMVAVVTVVTQAIVLAMFIPFILLGEVLRAATRQPLFVVDVEVVLDVPRRPR
ncbi:MAG TPA: hypothetical protein VNT79_19290 [Phycisphaerae bacterium]|nr:hypothetical protein [Phycisphaerae bacterium]